jgi:hypothetical protein
MDVASGVPYFVVTTGYDYAYGFPSVYANYGIKYENGQWTYISKNESTVNSYGEDWDKYIGGYPADGMVVMNNGVANMYYAETGEIYVYQNYNMEGPPIGLDQTKVGYDRGWAVWGNSSVGAIYSSIMHTNMGNHIQIMTNLKFGICNTIGMIPLRLTMLEVELAAMTMLACCWKIQIHLMNLDM